MRKVDCKNPRYNRYKKPRLLKVCPRDIAKKVSSIGYYCVYTWDYDSGLAMDTKATAVC